MSDANVSDFLTLLTQHQVRLRAFALSLVPHWADADEVLQQAYLAMWQKFDAFQPGTNFFSWAARFIQLTTMDFRKRQRRHQKRVPFGGEFIDRVAEETVAVADELAARERVLSECIRKLPPKQQALLDQRYQAGLSGEQMAARAGTTADAVYQSLARIRKTLFDCVRRGMGREAGLT